MKKEKTEMNYSVPTRKDGAWEIDYENSAANAAAEGFGSIEIFKQISRENGLDNRRPICLIENPDLEEITEGEGSADAGNIALMACSPEMYETLNVILKRGIEHSLSKHLFCLGVTVGTKNNEIGLHMGFGGGAVLVTVMKRGGGRPWLGLPKIANNRGRCDR